MTEQSKQGLLLSRVFNAPRELVFKVWTDPEISANGGVLKGFP